MDVVCVYYGDFGEQERRACPILLWDLMRPGRVDDTKRRSRFALRVRHPGFVPSHPRETPVSSVSARSIDPSITAIYLNRLPDKQPAYQTNNAAMTGSENTSNVGRLGVYGALSLPGPLSHVHSGSLARKGSRTPSRPDQSDCRASEIGHCLDAPR